MIRSDGFEELEDVWLRNHNKIRAEVGQAPIVWSDEIAATSLEYSKRCINEPGSCRTKKGWPNYFKHSTNNERVLNGIQLGENLAFGCPANLFNEQLAMEIWEEQKRIYRYPEGPGQHKNGHVGHWTQVVQRPLKEIGCGCSTCGDDSKFCVCRYNPMQYGFVPPF